MRRAPVIAGAVVAVVAITIGTLVTFRSLAPDHRIAFVVDGSTGDLAGVGAAVTAAAGNTGDRDALALRRFGGECGDAGNTAALVAAGRDNKDKIKSAVGTLTPAGKPTLLSGVLAAIDDFDARLPLRGRLSNRIIVVARHGADACTADQAAVSARIQDRLRERGLELDFRFVGFQVPAEERESFTALAGGSEPIFPQTPADLEAVLKQLTIPEPPDAAAIVLPSPPDPTADWTAFAYANAGQGYSLRYPPGWISTPCELPGQFNHWIAETPDLIGECVATDFFVYRVWVRINVGSPGGGAFTPDAGYGQTSAAPATTANGLAGQRYQGTVLEEDELGTNPVGTLQARYLFEAGGRSYAIEYVSYPGDARRDETLAVFDLMVTKTLRIEG